MDEIKFPRRFAVILLKLNDKLHTNYGCFVIKTNHETLTNILLHHHQNSNIVIVKCKEEQARSNKKNEEAAVLATS